MDLFAKEDVKNLLKSQEILPKKNFGQNFLVDKGAQTKFLAAANIQPEDTVLEIGPGIGNLTQELAKRAQKVITVEKDREMVKILKEQLGEIKNVEIVQGDIRKLDLKALDLNPGSYKVVANIPYYLTAFLIRSFLESQNPPKDMTLIIQKEVAQRICAQPPEMNLLAVSVQFYAKPKIISYIKKSSFWPIPKVDSAIIKIDIQQLTASKDKDLFFKIIKAGFLQPRKQLLNNLSVGLKMRKEETKSWLLANSLEPSQRAETLSVESWLVLTKNTFGSIRKTDTLK
jgi:16S rRNA (adenine1518-N6/adenine1519-N6)-dimethyltransferase